MKERPILMSGPMVRAILEGRKTQTRRVLKPQMVEGDWLFDDVHGALLRKDQPGTIRCPYGAEETRLWVRETFNDDRNEMLYRADGDLPADWFDAGSKWRPAIHMPRAACRLVLEITEVRVERLLDITVEDSFAEGIEWMRCPKCHLACYGLPGWGHDDLQKTPIEAYWHLWDQINEERGYGRAKNPWVWVVAFRRVAGDERKAA